MRSVLLFWIAAVLGLAPASLLADELPVGYISYDVVGLNTAEFDLINQTGPNSSIFPDTTFPVTTSVSFLDLMLTVDFASGPPIVYDASYFTLAPDGLSFDGTPFSTETDPISAVLTGTFSTTTVTLNDGTVVNIGPTFTATITDISGGTLQDADLAVIYAMTTGTSGVPEPGTWVLLGAGLLAVVAFRLRHNLRGLLRATSFFLLIAGCVLLPLSSASAAPAAIHLNVDTAPSAGSAGITFVNVTGSNFPSGTIPPANVSITLALSCGSSTTIPATAISVTPVVGTADKIEFELPASLTTSIYYVSITGSTSGGNPFASSNCSAVNVTNNTKSLASCVPTSSLAVLTGTNVVAYVPNGAWSSYSNGVQVVPIEGTGSPSTITTPNPVNSCSSNAFTSVTVCTANNTDVYLISGSTLTSTLTSGSNSYAGFTGGDCENCGVAINALTNQAVIAMGYSPSPSGSALQFLNLATNTFNAPIPTNYEVSEDIAVDPTRNLLLSPSESGIYDLFQIASDSSLTEFANTSFGGTLDSAAEDCSTGIGLSTVEFTQDLVITDLTQAVFTPGSPGSWTAPSNTVYFPDFDYFSAGTSGISVAPGTTHLGITTGEFGGNAFSAFLLPSTSGTGTPAVVDFASALMPATPDGCGFAQGLDPHTVTAYTSPNNNKAYGLMASSPPPAWIGVIDLQALLAAPRIPGQDPAGNPCSLCFNSVDPSYDLIANGVVRYVATGNPNCADFAKRVPQGHTKPIVPKISTREGQKLFKDKSK